MRVLLSAYACEPHKGSEPGIGWNFARSLSRAHEVWVLTRSNNEPAIRKYGDAEALERMRFVYFDLPRPIRWLKRGKLGLELYYYLWQFGVWFVARRWHRRVGFDVVNHVTFGRYWSPSFLALLPVPFVWGPVGGGESTPRPLRSGLGARGRAREFLRDCARWLGEHDPFVRLTARRTACAVVATQETGNRVRRLGARRSVQAAQVGLSAEDVRLLQPPLRDPPLPVQFISIGRLLDWKGFHLALEAFADPALADAEYWIVGGGPQERRLREAAERLGVASRVTFVGEVSRAEVLDRLRRCHVLVHPSMHDSGGWVLLEAMAAGRAVVCLDAGGPGAIVTDSTGIKIAPQTPADTILALRAAMRDLARERALRVRLGEAARRRIESVFPWHRRAGELEAVYLAVMGGGR